MQRLDKIDKLLQKMIHRRELLARQITWNPNATLAIAGILDPNVDIHAAGKKVKIFQALKGVLISATAFGGTQVNDLDTWLETQKKDVKPG